jgi:hypothetical protein
VIGRHATLFVWTVLGVVVASVQVTAVLSAGRFPGLGAVVGRATAGRVGRPLFVLAWMWLGWHAFAR